MKSATPNKPRLRSADRRRQILGVATELFAHQGYQGTTTRQIAESAGVNEAIVFRHFPTKEALYWGVLDAICRVKRGRHELEERMRQKLSDRELFIAIAEDILRRQRDPTLSRLLLFSALENHRLSQRFFQTYIVKFYEALAGHIRQRVRRGNFRKLDAMLAARGFLGMVSYHFLMQEIYGGKRFQRFNQRHVCETLADIWLSGVAAKRRKRTMSGKRQSRILKKNVV